MQDSKRDAANEFDVEIVGGGLAGCLLFLVLQNRFPTARLLLREASRELGGNHTWCCHDTDIPASLRALMLPLFSRSWGEHQVFFPRFHRVIPRAYHALRAEDLRSAVQARPQDRIELGATVSPTDPARAPLRVWANGWPPVRNAANVAYQKFVGWDVRLRKPHGETHVTLMDARVLQKDGFRFLYVLPWDESRLLVEDTYYSSNAALDDAAIEAELRRYITERGWELDWIERRERGILPLDLFPPERADTKEIRLGAASGLAHPVTGYTMPLTLRVLARVAAAGSLDEAAWRRITEESARELRGQFVYFCALNRMLFRAAHPDERYRVLERFYTFSEDLIANFYRLTLGPFERARVLMGRPPVPVVAAVRAIAQARRD